MRIAYLINQYPAVSHSFIRREIHALERQGFEITRIALRGGADLVDPEDQRERERTRYVLTDGSVALALATLRMLMTRPVAFARALALACRVGRRADRPLLVHLAYLAEACRIVPWLRANDVEHLHAHFGTNSATVAMLVRVLGGPQWSFTVHGSELHGNPALIGLPEKIGRCAFVVAISCFGRSQLYRLVDHRLWTKVEIVRCGLEPGFFAEPLAALPARPRLICVGRLSAEKGQLLLVDAAARLAAQGVDFELIIAGDGDMRPHIEALIARHSLASRIRITGWISSGQVRAEIQAARALVLPSFAEGIPVVLMEAMALGRPVIATWVGGIPELVISGEHGWLVPPGDVEALADAMRSCLKAPAETITRMGKAARARVQERHNADTETAKLAALFRDAARAGQPRSTPGLP